jgi:hypothetical protein
MDGRAARATVWCPQFYGTITELVASGDVLKGE